MDIDVEHEGKRTKVTPTPPASSGPPSARSESGSIGLLSKGSGPGSQATEESISEGTKVNQYPSSSDVTFDTEASKLASKKQNTCHILSQSCACIILPFFIQLSYSSSWMPLSVSGIFCKLLVITSMSPFLTFCMRAPSSFEYESQRSHIWLMFIPSVLGAERPRQR